MARSQLCFLALVALATLAAPNRAADGPARKGKPAPARQEDLERFRKMSPEERLQRAEKAGGPRQAFIPVTRADLDVALVERGSLDAADATDIVCRLQARAGGSASSTIRWVVDDGQFVKKGDRLIEFDDSALREQFKAQKVAA